MPVADEAVLLVERTTALDFLLRSLRLSRSGKTAREEDAENQSNSANVQTAPPVGTLRNRASPP